MTRPARTPREILLRQMLIFALNEIHNPGAYRHSVGGDITDDIEKLLNDTRSRFARRLTPQRESTT